MSFLNDLNVAVFDHEFEKSNDLVVHELHRDRSTTHVREFLCAESNILPSLHDANLIFAALRLNGNSVVAAVFIETNVHLVNLNLPDAFDRRAKVVFGGCTW